MANKIKISRQEVYNMIWEIGLGKTSLKLNCDPRELLSVCKSSNIPLPTKAYVDELKKNKVTHKPLLPSAENDDVEITTLYKRRKSVEHVVGYSANPIAIFQTLEDYSGENQALSVEQIQYYLDKNYRLKIDRRTIYNTVKMLRDQLFYDIHISKHKGKNYYSLLSKNLDASDAKIIIESMRLNPLLSTAEESRISRKVLPHIATRDMRTIGWNSYKVIDNYNSQLIYSNLDKIDEALLQSKKISFTYMKSNTCGELVPDANKVVIPYTITIKNYTYYLMCKGTKSKRYDLYRIDRMQDICVTDEKYEMPASLIVNNSDFTSDEYIQVVLKCDIDLTEKISDDFSHIIKSISFEDDKNGKTFTVTIPGGLNELACWAASVVDKCEVIEPKEVRDLVIEKIKNNKYGV